MTLQTFVPTFPLFPVLADSIAFTRELTGSSNSFQITDTQIVKNMNSFYSYDLPAKYRSLKLKDVYTFTTNVGQDVYPFNSELYTTVEMPCYCAKRELKLYNDPWNFYGVNFNWQQYGNFATGNGTTGSVTAVITGSSNASSAVFTVADTSNLTTGETVILNNFAGGTWSTINGNSYIVTILDGTTFSVNGLNSTGFGAYTADTGSFYTSPYNGQTIGTPISRSVNNDPGPQSNPSLYFPMNRVQNVLITANVIGTNGVGQTQTVTDDGQGNLIQIFQTSNTTNQEYGWTYYRQYASSTPNSPGNATINYQTGVITGLTFATAIPQGTPIQIQYNARQPSIPLAIMFYQNQFTVAPMPDKGYTIELTAYRQPIKALLAMGLNGNPELSEWWEILSIGAAKKIFERRFDSDGIIMIDKMLKERYDIIETRSYAQIGSRQIYTIYSDQVNYNYSQNGFGAYFGGP